MILSLIFDNRINNTFFPEVSYYYALQVTFTSFDAKYFLQ